MGQLNTMLPEILNTSFDSRGYSFVWFRDVTCHCSAAESALERIQADYQSMRTALELLPAQLNDINARFEDVHTRITTEVDAIRLAQCNAADELHALHASVQQLQDEVLVSNQASAVLDHLATRINEVETDSASRVEEELQRLGSQLDDQLAQFLADLPTPNPSAPSSHPGPSEEDFDALRRLVDDLSSALARQGREILQLRQDRQESEAALRSALSRATTQIGAVETAYEQELSAAKDAFSALRERHNALLEHTDQLSDALEVARADIEDLREAQDQARVNLSDVIEEMRDNRCHCGSSSSGPSLEQLFTTSGSTTLRHPNSSEYDGDSASSAGGRRSIPRVFVAQPTPEETPPNHRTEAPRSASCTNFFARPATAETATPRRPQTENSSGGRFKPMNLPKFDPKGNVRTFIRLFKMSMYGASDQDKATTLLNQLDAASTDLIIPHMPENDWSYQAAKDALLHEFGSLGRLTERKKEFLSIQFRRDESINEFADRFYLEAQTLTGSGTLTVHDAHIALKSAVRPYKTLYRTLMPALQDGTSVESMMRYLRQCADTFSAPNQSRHRSNNHGSGGHHREPAEKAQVSAPRPSPGKKDLSGVTCHRCNRRGHYATDCKSKTAVHVLQPEPNAAGKEQVE